MLMIIDKKEKIECWQSPCREAGRKVWGYRQRASLIRRKKTRGERWMWRAGEEEKTRRDEDEDEDEDEKNMSKYNDKKDLKSFRWMDIEIM